MICVIATRLGRGLGVELLYEEGVRFAMGNRFTTGPVRSCINRKTAPAQGGLQSLGTLRNAAVVESRMV